MKVKSLRVTDLSLGLRCPMQLWFKLTVGPRPPGIAAVFGTAFHSSVELDLKAKKNGIEIEIEELQENFRDTFIDRAVEAIPEDNDRPISELLDLGVASVEGYHFTFVDKVNPLLIEHPFEVDTGAVKVRGKVDLVAKKLGAIDHKTAWRRWEKGREARELQALGYNLLFYIKHNRILPFTFSITYPHLVLSKRADESFELRKVQKTKEQMQTFIEIIENLVDMLEREKPIPNTSGYWCNPKFCGWFNLCRFGSC